MTVTSFEVGSIFQIVDRATPTLERLSKLMRELAKLSSDTKKSLDALGKVNFGPLEGNLKTLTERIDAMAVSVDKAAETMTTATDAAAASARALAQEWRAAAAAATQASRAINPAMLRSLGTGGRAAGGMGISARLPGLRGPGSHIGIHGGGNAAMIGAGAIAYGVFEQAELEKAAAQAVYIYNNGNLPDAKTQEEQRKSFREMVMDAAGKTGKNFRELSDVALTDIRQRANDPDHPTSFARLMQGLPGLLVTASQESDLRGGTSIKEAGDSLVAFAHMLKVYDPVEMQQLYPSLAYLSMHSPQTLKRITTAAGYHIPTTSAGLDVDPIEEMALQVGLERAGVLNTKSGTWLRELALRSLPEVKGMVPDSVYNDKLGLLRAFGLADDAGKPTWFAGGRPDEMKLLEIVSGRALAMPPEERGKMERYLFGAQGAGAIGVLTDPKVLPQLRALADDDRSFRSGADYFRYMGSNSPIQNFQQTWVDLQKVLMDIGTVALPPVIGSLQTLDSWLKSIHEHTPGFLVPKKDSLGEALGKGMGAGAAIGGGLGAITGFGLLPGAAGGAFIGGAWEGGKWLFGGAKDGAEEGTRAGAATGTEQGVVAGFHKMSFTMPSTGSDELHVGIPTGTRPININNVLTLDGRVVARNTVKHIIDQGNMPASSGRLYDSSTTRPISI